MPRPQRSGSPGEVRVGIQSSSCRWPSVRSPDGKNPCAPGPSPHTSRRARPARCEPPDDRVVQSWTPRSVRVRLPEPFDNVSVHLPGHHPETQSRDRPGRRAYSVDGQSYRGCGGFSLDQRIQIGIGSASV